MTGPQGSMTNRDRRREARKQQLRRTQSSRQQVRHRQIRTQRLQRGVVILFTAVLIILIGLLVAHFAFGFLGASAQPATPAHRVAQSSSTGQSAQAAQSAPPSQARTIDGLPCTSTSGQTTTLHVYLALYVNGKQQQVPGGVGTNQAAGCAYPLFVSPASPDYITAQSTNGQQFSLGQFMDIWGKQLSKTSYDGHTSSAQQPLTFQVSNGQGHLSSYTGDPRAIALKDHETIVVEYNSPQAHPSAQANWKPVQ